MVPPSNEVLSNSLENMEKQNNKEHTEIKELLTSLSSKLDELEKKYVTRLEFKAVSLSIGLLATLLAIVGFFTNN